MKLIEQGGKLYLYDFEEKVLYIDFPVFASRSGEAVCGRVGVYFYCQYVSHSIIS